MRVAIYLRSGAMFRFEADKITVKTHRTTGDLAGIEWDGAIAGAPMFLRMEDVSAVVTERDSGTIAGQSRASNGR